jgi:hypothetical protein
MFTTATRRMMLAATCTRIMVHSRAAYAEESGNVNLRTRFEELNKRDTEVVRKERYSELLKWKAVKEDKAFLNISEDVQEELLFVKAFYERALSLGEKVRLREKLLTLYEHPSRTEAEKECLLKIMSYYKLFE